MRLRTRLKSVSRNKPGEGHKAGPCRRCLVCREVAPKEEMIRFVCGPAEEIVPDVAGKLGGRGLWVHSRREEVEKAVSGGLFARAARRRVRASGDLPERTALLLHQRALNYLGLARRAGQVVAGYEKVCAALKKGADVAVLVEASDGSGDGRDRIESLAPGIAVVDCFGRDDLSLALGRNNVVHAALMSGTLAQRFQLEAARFSGFIPRASTNERVSEK